MSFELKEIPKNPNKVAIITGGNSGVGYYTAKALAEKDFLVIMACRKKKRARRAIWDIQTDDIHANLKFIRLDLSSLDSVRKFTSKFLKKYDRLDLLINNAGIMAPPFKITKDGFESQFQVNYLGHFLLTKKLLPLMQKTAGSRIISLSSKAHENGKIDFNNLQGQRSYSRFGAYRQSKLACLIFALELDRKLKEIESPVLSLAAHPGASNTNLAKYIPKWLKTILLPIFYPLLHSPQKAALPTLFAALGNHVASGEYFGPKGILGLRGKPGKVQPAKQAKDPLVAHKLWKVSEELIAEEFHVNPIDKKSRPSGKSKMRA